MHFALPPRKSSFPPPYARASARSAATQKRKKQIQLLGYLVLGTLTFVLSLRWVFRISKSGHDDTVSRETSVTIVTVFDESSMSEDGITMVKANRDDYAKRHGYKTFYTNASTYSQLTGSSPSTWSLIPAIRHALSLHPDTDYIWSLSSNAFITNASLSLHDHILSPLPTLMLKNIPVVPPDSVIHTYSHLKASQAYLILTQDSDNIAHSSFLLRNSLTIPVQSDESEDSWTHYFLDAWFDPLYRAYSFQKAEKHALEHIVQWHPTVLAKVVLIDQHRMNSYNFHTSPSTSTKDKDKQKEQDKDKAESETPLPAKDGMWQPGDLVVNFKGCKEDAKRDCEAEMRAYFSKWTAHIERLDGKKPDIQLKVVNYQYQSVDSAMEKAG